MARPSPSRNKGTVLKGEGKERQNFSGSGKGESPPPTRKKTVIHLRRKEKRHQLIEEREVNSDPLRGDKMRVIAPCKGEIFHSPLTKEKEESLS